MTRRLFCHVFINPNVKTKYFLTDIFILSAEKQPIKLSWRKIEWLRILNISSIQEKELILIP